MTENTYWLKQTKDKALFEDLLWSRPENKNSAGKLLIIGGDSHSFAVPAEAYTAASDAGAGVVKVLLPDTVKSLVPPVMQSEIEFAPGIKNGGFAKNSVAEMLDYAAWADAVLIAGGVGRNSETAIALESFIKLFKGQLAITHDALDVFVANPKVLFERAKTLIVAAFGQLQKAWHQISNLPAITSDMNLVQIVEVLHQLTQTLPAIIITKHQDMIVVAYGGQVSTTKTDTHEEVWRVKTAAAASVWWLQNPTKPLESITTSLIAG